MSSEFDRLWGSRVERILSDKNICRNCDNHRIEIHGHFCAEGMDVDEVAKGLVKCYFVTPIGKGKKGLYPNGPTEQGIDPFFKDQTKK